MTILYLTTALWLPLAWAANPPQTGDSFTRSYQRELNYLTAQKEALSKQRTQMELNFSKRIAAAKGQTLKLQTQSARLAAENDELHEQLIALEKRRKDFLKRGAHLADTFEKAHKSLAQFKRELHFEIGEGAPTAAPLNEPPRMGDLSAIFHEGEALLTSAASKESFAGHYLDHEDRLREGRITRLGRVAAFVERQDGRFLLGPSGSGPLKSLEPKAGAGLYLIGDLNEAARIQKAATWVERLADMGPVLFLTLMLLLVAGLFMALVRI